MLYRIYLKVLDILHGGRLRIYFAIPFTVVSLEYFIDKHVLLSSETSLNSTIQCFKKFACKCISFLSEFESSRDLLLPSAAKDACFAIKYIVCVRPVTIKRLFRIESKHKKYLQYYLFDSGNNQFTCFSQPRE